MRPLGGSRACRLSKWSLGGEAAARGKAEYSKHTSCFQIFFTPIKYWNLELDLNLDFKEPKSYNMFGLPFFLLKQKVVARRSKPSGAIKI